VTRLSCAVIRNFDNVLIDTFRALCAEGCFSKECVAGVQLIRCDWCALLLSHASDVCFSLSAEMRNRCKNLILGGILCCGSMSHVYWSWRIKLEVSAALRNERRPPAPPYRPHVRTPIAARHGGWAAPATAAPISANCGFRESAPKRGRRS